MLQTINKNLTKLTTETLKNQLILSDVSNTSLSSKDYKKTVDQSNEQIDNTKHKVKAYSSILSQSNQAFVS